MLLWWNKIWILKFASWATFEKSIANLLPTYLGLATILTSHLVFWSNKYSYLNYGFVLMVISCWWHSEAGILIIPQITRQISGEGRGTLYLSLSSCEEHLIMMSFKWICWTSVGGESSAWKFQVYCIDKFIKQSTILLCSL